MLGSFLLEFIDQANQSRDIGSIRRAMQRTMDHVGLSRWAYVIDNIIIHNYPAAWVDHYISRNYAQVDPIITRGSARTLPFRWSDVASLDSLSRRESEYYREAIDFGLIDGLGVPIRDGAQNAMFTVASDEKKSEIDQRLAIDGRQFIALGFAFHAIFQHAVAPKRTGPSPLSPRETECLLWASRGKTSWEIGQILNIVERTVVFHIENCKRKLAVKNRSQAVVEAIAAGYIQP